MQLPILLVGTVEGVIVRNLYDHEEVECPTVAQQWVDRYRCNYDEINYYTYISLA